MLKMTSLRKFVQKAARVPLQIIQREKKPAGRPAVFHPLLRLQQTIGNQAVSRLIQAKLKVGQPGDRYEQEADHVAEAVMRMPEPWGQRQVEEEEEETVQAKLHATQPPELQRQDAAEEEKEERIQAKGKRDHASGDTPGLEDKLTVMRGGGQPLPQSLRTFFEARFGRDFNRVRVHTDAEADTLSRSLSARAFTIGHNIFFRRGSYSPDSPRGRKLLAHELTHTIQQEKAPHAGSTIRQKDEAPEAKDKETAESTPTTKSTKKLSGPDWCDQFPTSRKTDDLASGFKESVEKFIAALKAAGASVTISATKRPAERAYLMHYAFKLSKNKIKCDAIPSKAGVDIEWCHRDAKGNIDHNASREAAEKMVKKYNIAYAPALTSLHIQGKAIDMTISWSGDLTIKDHSGKEVVIKSTPRNGNNTELHKIGKGYGVKKLVSDPPHWSSTGK